MLLSAPLRHMQYLVYVLVLLSQSMLLLADARSVTSSESLIHYQDYLRMVLKANPDIQQQHLNWGIASVAVGTAIAEFDPVLSLEITANDNSNPRSMTADELVNRVINQQQSIDHIGQHGGLFLEEKPVGSEDLSLGITQKIKTGATVALSVITQKSRYYSAEAANRPSAEHVAYAGVTFAQPLLKGRGSAVTYAQWHVTEQARASAYQDWRRQVVDALLSAGSAYWDLYLTQQQLDIRLSSLKIAQDLLADQRLMLAHGAGNRVDVVDGEVGVSVRLSDQAKAEQQYENAEKALRQMAMLPLSTSGIRLGDAPQVQPLHIVPADRIAQARRQSPTYLRQQIVLVQEDIRLVYAANQLYPQLDLKGSYGFNGLGINYDRALGMVARYGYPKWTIGVSLSSPLGKNNKARSEYDAARLRKMYAIQKLQAIDIELEDSIETAVDFISQDWDQIVALRHAVDSTEEQFQIARQRLDGGAGTVRSVLERESEYNRLREMLLTSEVNYKKSILALSNLDGSLLLDFNLESANDVYDLDVLQGPLPVLPAIRTHSKVADVMAVRVDDDGTALVKGTSLAKWGGSQTALNGTDPLPLGRSLPVAQGPYGLGELSAVSDRKNAHNEFMVMGHSLYYLKHQQTDRESLKLRLEHRDPIHGTVTSSRDLLVGDDYAFDAVAGRITFLQQPPHPSTGSTVVADVMLVADYRYRVVADGRDGNRGGIERALGDDGLVDVAHMSQLWQDARPLLEGLAWDGTGSTPRPAP